MSLKRDILIGLAVLGVLLIGIGIVIGLIFLLTKALGIVLILGGIFMMFFFPDIGEWQPHSMSKTGIVLGIILTIIGVLFLII